MTRRLSPPLMGVDEEGTLRQLKAHRKELVDPKITEHRGRIVKTTGDGMLVEFAASSMPCAAPSTFSAVCSSTTPMCQPKSASNSASASMSATNSIAWIERNIPYTPGPMAKFLDGMRKAGLQ
jgi:class 3 adenylate cyclase